MKTRIHINQHKIRSNRQNGEMEPVITAKTYKSNNYAHEVIIKDKDGNEVARVVYRPDKPLPCGAHCWVETDSDVELLVRGSKPEPGRGEDCCCYQGCEGKDGPWHQHADDPCPTHPDAPVLGGHEEVTDGK